MKNLEVFVPISDQLLRDAGWSQEDLDEQKKQTMQLALEVLALVDIAAKFGDDLPTPQELLVQAESGIPEAKDSSDVAGCEDGIFRLGRTPHHARPGPEQDLQPRPKLEPQ